MNDPVLDTLFLPLEDGAIDWPVSGPALFLRARSGDALDEIARDKLVCEQSFKPAYDTLIRAGFAMRDEAAPAELTLVLPPRQREESRALLARAIGESAKGGIVIAVQRELGVPVKLVGLGEGPDDLAPFDPEAFVDAILGDEAA